MPRGKKYITCTPYYCPPIAPIVMTFSPADSHIKKKVDYAYGIRIIGQRYCNHDLYSCFEFE